MCDIVCIVAGSNSAVTTISFSQATHKSLEETKHLGTEEAGWIYLQTVISHEIFHALGFGLFER